MARLPIPVTTLGSNYPARPLTANSADVTWTPASATFAQGASFYMTGKEILLIHNDNAGAQTVTITSVLDEKNRLGTITAYSVGIQEYAAIPFLATAGWAQLTSNLLYFEASAADVNFAVLRIP